MAFWRSLLQTLLMSFSLVSATVTFVCFLFTVSVHAQSRGDSSSNNSAAGAESGDGRSSFSSSLQGLGGSGADAERLAAMEFPLPEAPRPVAYSMAAGREPYNVPPSADQTQAPFSRIGIGADVSPLGIGIKSAIVLTPDFDARLMVNFFGYTSGRFEVEGFNVNANVHMASMAASLDWYPFGSVFRLSPGLMFFNANQISGNVEIIPGTSFSLNNQTFYSASANAVTGATPVTGTGVLGFHANQPAGTLTGGFGNFISRSNRHWTFPSEFGVVFTGGPTFNVNPSGWVCLDAAQTQCTNLAVPTNPVTIEFNNALNTMLTKWRRDLNKVQIYPIFSYSVVYSFNIR